MGGRSRLRSLLRETAGERCEWIGCAEAGTEMAHLHSVGMGGRESADCLENVAWMCFRHARMTDGLFTSWPDFKQAHDQLFGRGWEERIPMGRWAFERAERLAEHVKRRRET